MIKWLNQFFVGVSLTLLRENTCAQNVGQNILTKTFLIKRTKHNDPSG